MASSKYKRKYDTDPPQNPKVGRHNNIDNNEQQIKVTPSSLNNNYLSHPSALACDVLILDYLVYKATKGLLEVRRLERRAGFIYVDYWDVTNLIKMVDSFVYMFRGNHPDYQFNDDQRLRLKICRFAITFCRRYQVAENPYKVQMLLNMREKNTARAEAWQLEHSTEIPDKKTINFNLGDEPNPQPILERIRSGISVPPTCKAYGQPETMSLLDMLSELLTLTALEAKRHKVVASDMTVEMILKYMMQAALEQYTVFGQTSISRVYEAFSYGWTDHMALQGDDKDLAELFENDNGYHERKDWKEKRAEYMTIILNKPPTLSWLAHFENLTRTHTMDATENMVLRYLEELFNVQEKPEIIQILNGTLPDVSKEEQATLANYLLYGHARRPEYVRRRVEEQIMAENMDPVARQGGVVENVRHGHTVPLQENMNERD